ncbi:RsiG family protein, partial [Streptomyces scabiei]
MSTSSTGQPPGTATFTRTTPGPGPGIRRPPVQRTDSGPLPPPDQAEHDLSRLRLPELRALRRDAQRDEADLSYLRRLLQGRIDILCAELA